MSGHVYGFIRSVRYARRGPMTIRLKNQYRWTFSICSFSTYSCIPEVRFTDWIIHWVRPKRKWNIFFFGEGFRFRQPLYVRGVSRLRECKASTKVAGSVSAFRRVPKRDYGVDRSVTDRDQRKRSENGLKASRNVVRPRTSRPNVLFRALPMYANFPAYTTVVVVFEHTTLR